MDMPVDSAALIAENSKKEKYADAREFEVSVAPMVGISTPEYRRFMRVVSPNSLVFTEMVVDTSLIHMSSSVLERKIGLPSDKCILQVGGSNPAQIAQAVKRALALGYDKFNLNCGCPSDRVQNGAFGAMLMKDPHLIASIIQRAYDETGVVMSVKCRIGVDDVEDYPSFKKMIEIIVENTPCRTFYVHARKCLLKGLSPADNRRIPPLKYEYVFQLKREMPFLKIILNGGLREVQSIQELQHKVDGVMLGRKPMDDPMFFAEIESRIFGKSQISTLDAIAAYLKELEKRVPERDLFMKKDVLSPCLTTVPNKARDHDPNVLSNIKMTESGEIEYLCRHVDLKPIEPVLHGRKGCKEYKREIARLARERKPTTSVIPNICKYFSVLANEGERETAVHEQ
ncbi:tRNA-dihydrouridine synthase A [Nematocida minor]|uniref:tRNA-dihydrouridine synthase A n=1 Tax=Nematocida minor TaxID=1912983 RepID=UPI00221E98BA|nr:tRNA-dihydrouridine synthase A [Nematocida minor]KAI5190817.1 tRNA-dihydrouridine synthase A [Nematocida minor]